MSKTNEKGNVPIKKNKNGPMIATLRIKELDKLVSRLKQNAINCNQCIVRDENALYHIDKEIMKIKARYDPLCQRLEERKVQRKLYEEQYQQVSSQMSQLLAHSKGRLRQSNTIQVKQLEKNANLELTASRGYSLGQESTFYRKQ